MESTMEELNYRVKGTEKFSNERGAEALVPGGGPALAEARRGVSSRRLRGRQCDRC